MGIFSSLLDKIEDRLGTNSPTKDAETRLRKSQELGGQREPHIRFEHPVITKENIDKLIGGTVEMTLGPNTVITATATGSEGGADALEIDIFGNVRHLIMISQAEIKRGVSIILSNGGDEAQVSVVATRIDPETGEQLVMKDEMEEQSPEGRMRRSPTPGLAA
ncbi:MAG: hypothetical protein Q8P95_02180 [bacterium]|nr:hypothetical protein [bacterium]